MTDAATNRTIVALFDHPTGAIRAYADLDKVGIGEAFTMLGGATAKAEAGLAGLNEAGEGFGTNYEVVYDDTFNRGSALIASGVPEEDAEAYAECVRHGNVVLLGRLHEDQAILALDVIGKHQPVEVDERRNAYRNSGWIRYDGLAPDYDAAQIAEEEARHRSTREAAAARGSANAAPRAAGGARRVRCYVTDRP